jgi:hypothetical protein
MKATISNWKDDMAFMDPANNGPIDLEENIFPRDVAGDTIRDNLHKEEDHGATGNEGHTVERWYRVTAFVLTSMDKYQQNRAASQPSDSADELLAR